MSERKERRRNILTLVIAIPVLLIALLIAGCSRGFVSGEGDAVVARPPSVSPLGSPTNGMVQSHTGGEVTIDLEWRGPENGSLVFYVTMNTHSVDLDQYDLKELAVLRDSGGNEYSPTSWDSPPGGHHTKGTLGFNPPGSLERGETEYIEIIIRDVAGIEERVLKWEL